MKKTFAVGFAVVMMLVASTVSFAGRSENTSKAMSDHEGKPCHVTDRSSGARCSCRSCYGNNWGNTYCTRCGHSVKSHY